MDRWVKRARNKKEKSTMQDRVSLFRLTDRDTNNNNDSSFQRI
jgi:hypothetical protein